jgi:hypothetical protein
MNSNYKFYLRLFSSLPEMLVLEIVEYLNNGPFIIKYNKFKKGLYIEVNKKYCVLTKVLEYKLSHPPKFTLVKENKFKIIFINTEKTNTKERYIYNWCNELVKHLIYYGYKAELLLDKWDQSVKLIKQTKTNI